MTRYLLVEIVLLCGLLSGTAWAEPTCQVDPVREKFYRLELTVPATFCAANRGDPGCRQFPKASLIQLHGLWPNYLQGFPEGECSAAECREQADHQGKYCGYPKPPDLYASQSWMALNSYMAGVEKCLERHEWVKHGTCTPMKATDYFGWGLQKTKEIADKLSLPADRPISKVAFDSLVARKLPELKGAFNLRCKGNQLQSVFVLYEWDENGPGEPKRNRSGRNSIACPKTFVIPAKPQ